ncbi:MAG TPA: hypothetical protein VF342_12560 [Alphaproteobacteria bacterium]
MVFVFRTENLAWTCVPSMLFAPRRRPAAHLVMRYPDGPATDRSIPVAPMIAAAAQGFRAA